VKSLAYLAFIINMFLVPKRFTAPFMDIKISNSHGCPWPLRGSGTALPVPRGSFRFKV
jgi:hypothetical protein